MDQQNNSNSNMPNQSDKKGSSTLIVAVIFGMIIVASIVYTNLSIKSTNDKIKDLNSKTALAESRTAKLEEVSKKGASDELLGFDTVDKNGFQSVFLTSGQVYFGKITSMTTENFVLEDIYYLKDGGSDQSLVKLGCELHKPEDKLTIVRSNVQFWENLKDNDKNGVIGAITEYKKANPDGQKCS